MSANPTAMQQALLNAAVDGGSRKFVKAVLRSADRIKVTEPKPSIKLSYRTAQKLKQQGVL